MAVPDVGDGALAEVPKNWTERLRPVDRDASGYPMGICGSII
jgi:hypothetical protein